MDKYILIGITIDNQIVVKKTCTIDENNTNQWHLKTAICEFKTDRHLEFWPLTANYRKNGETGINEDSLKSVHKFAYNHGDGVSNVLSNALSTLGF
jgi:hypothetical protein